MLSLTCTLQLTLPYTMSVWVPYYNSRPHGPVVGETKVGRSWGGCSESRQSGGWATWIYPVSRMRVFWSELQMAAWTRSEMVGNEARGRSGA